MTMPVRKAAKQAAPIFPPLAEFKFEAGPYVVPKVKIGSSVHDERFGDVVVEGFTEAPIAWPGFRCKRMGRHVGLMPILFDGLVRAVVEENEIVVAHYWHVARNTISLWKRALAGCEGSSAVYMALALKRAEPAFRKKFGYR